MRLEASRNKDETQRPYPFPVTRKLESHRFIVDIADEKTIEDVLRLRYQVFTQEMGYSPDKDNTGLDQDQYDSYCDHLIVRDLDTNMIVGTYRLLRSDVAKKQCGFYSENEFDLSCLYKNNLTFVEVGRACIKQDYRGQLIVSMLWMGLSKYCEYHHIQYIIGCTTVGRDAHSAAMIYHYTKHINALADQDIFPIKPNKQNKVEELDLSHPPDNVNAIKHELPTLIRAYLSIGGSLVPEPAYDPSWDVIDFFTIVHFDKNIRRIMRFFGS